MLISAAYAAANTAAGAAADTAATQDPGTGQAFVLNIILIVIMVGLFYFMMIVPQQKRMRRHGEMLKGLKKGDKIITAGGLLGNIEKIADGEEEVMVDFGNGIKMKTLRSMIEIRPEIKDPKKDVK